MSTDLFPKLANLLNEILPACEAVSPERKQQLTSIAEFVREKIESGQTAHLVFICTHNSRRSHFGQIWAAVAAHYHGLGEVVATFSGGTEATAFHPNAIQALQEAGFEITRGDGNNPNYSIGFDPKTPPLSCFSKMYDHPHNPQVNFAAIMTCTRADEDCPFVSGATARYSLPYQDPKEADGTPSEAQTYSARSRQIAAEMMYLFAQV